MSRDAIAVILVSALLGCQEPATTTPEQAHHLAESPAETTAPAADEPPEAAPPTTVEPPSSAPASPPADPPAPDERSPILTLAFVGDVVLGEYVGHEHRSFAGPEAPAPPFARVLDSLRADVLVGNLESPVMFERPARSPLRRGHRFGASASAVDELARAGFDVMSVANNHANDLGRAGLEQTPQILRDRGLLPVGAARHEGSPFVVQTLVTEGWRLGFVSAATWLNTAPAPDEPQVPLSRTSELHEVLVPVLAAARAEHDLLVVLVHWGRERREAPGAPIVHAAHALVDAGADLVIGHHPHVLQGIEHYGDGLIAYSLGNFLFPARIHEFRDTGVLRVRWNVPARCPERATFEALRLDRAPGHAPRPATDQERRAIFDRVQRLGRAHKTRWRDEGSRLTMEGCRPKDHADHPDPNADRSG